MEHSREAALRGELAALTTQDAGILLFGEDVPERNRSDRTSPTPSRPLALARPRSTEQVSAVLAACHALGISVTPQGGLTGLVGGAHPDAGGVALSLERMSGVEELDVEAGLMTVLSGTPLQTAQAAAETAGLGFPLDLGSRGSCTIGGNIATNAGGNRVIRYGPMRDHVLGLEVVLADGTVLHGLNRLVKNNTGYDLKHLFIGSEGTLGVVTRAVLRLQPKPPGLSVAICAAPGPEALLRLLAGLRDRFGPGLSAFEAMWPNYWRYMAGHPEVRLPFDDSHGAYAIVEVSGFDPERDAARLEETLAAFLEEGVLTDAAVAQTGREADAFWRIREAVGEVRRTSGPITAFDISLEARVTDRFLQAAEARIRARWPDAVFLAYGHLGDNNVHIVVNLPSAGPSQPKDEIQEEVYAAMPRTGGSISAEHGIGLAKKRWLGLSRSPEELAVMRLVKNALDPKGIMNPGKILDA